MSRTARFRLVCNIVAALLALVAARQLVNPVLVSIDPILGSAQLNCSPCRYDLDPVRLLDVPLQERGWRDAAVEQKIVKRLALPRVQILLFLSEAAAALPLVALFGALALAMKNFAGQGFSSDAVRWVRLAAMAALVWALLGPASRSLSAYALDPVFTGIEQFRLPVDFYHLIRGLLIGGTAYAVAWALEEARSLQSELSEYV